MLKVSKAENQRGRTHLWLLRSFSIFNPFSLSKVRSRKRIKNRYKLCIHLETGKKNQVRRFEPFNIGKSRKTKFPFCFFLGVRRPLSLWMILLSTDISILNSRAKKRTGEQNAKRGETFFLSLKGQRRASDIFISLPLFQIHAHLFLPLSDSKKR